MQYMLLRNLCLKRYNYTEIYIYNKTALTHASHRKVIQTAPNSKGKKSSNSDQHVVGISLSLAPPFTCSNVADHSFSPDAGQKQPTPPKEASAHAGHVHRHPPSPH